MKTILVLSILFWAIALPALGELTDADLDKIRLIVKQELKAEITSSEKSIKEYINIRIDSVEKRLSTYNWVIYVLMPLIVATVGIPTAMIAWRSGKDRSLERQVETPQTGNRNAEATANCKPLTK